MRSINPNPPHCSSLFSTLSLAMGALLSREPLVPAAAFDLHLHPVAVACVLLTAAALFWMGIHTISFLLGRGLANRELLCRAGSAGAGTSGSAAGPQGRHFVMLFLAMRAALNAEAFDAAAAELGLHPAAVGIIVLAVAALFNLAIFTVNFLVARRPAEGETMTVLRPTASAAVALTCHASTPQLPHFLVLCLAMGTALLAEPLVAAAADLGVHSVVLASFVLAVTALYNWAILSINFRVACRAAEREPKMLPRPDAPAASSARSPNLARLAFLVLAALVSASWFVELFAAAAELCMSKAVIFAFVVLFAALFNVSIHLFRSFFLPDPPSAVTSAAQGHGVGAITAGVISIGIPSAACVVGAGGPTYTGADSTGQQGFLSPSTAHHAMEPRLEPSLKIWLEKEDKGEEVEKKGEK